MVILSFLIHLRYIQYPQRIASYAKIMNIIVRYSLGIDRAPYYLSYAMF
jgi:hypothetical protein